MRGGRKDEEGRAISKSGNFQLCSHAINLGTTLNRTPLLTSLKRYSPWRAPSLAVAHVRPDAVRPERLALVAVGLATRVLVGRLGLHEVWLRDGNRLSLRPGLGRRERRPRRGGGGGYGGQGLARRSSGGVGWLARPLGLGRVLLEPLLVDLVLKLFDLDVGLLALELLLLFDKEALVFERVDKAARMGEAGEGRVGGRVGGRRCEGERQPDER
ncbi:hypothetical protein DMC30DRAFT_402109 [Rhodotorula diobovata]|uniref:Uncharacterized protein n=1 Tax=Rhodotorula diobovata TaxID=5288 RepID=A0A5C5FRG2_9BASI|nr:hypothetical protein DMC30DRAFT_402109 [Rhodotorula diobovata]